MKSQHDPSSFTRRSLLGGSASVAAATALSRSARAAAGSSAKPVLVQIFLRGAMDGLTTVVPYGDGDLYNLRPTLAIGPPGPSSGALDLDGFFGLAPAAAPLLTPYNDGRLVIVHAVGSNDTTRSHFEAEASMELADHTHSISSGWASRYLSETAGSSTSQLRGIGVGTNLPLTLSEAPLTLPIGDFYLNFPGVTATSLMRQNALLDAYAQQLPHVAAPAFDTVAAFAVLGVDFSTYVPENDAQYPQHLFGRRLKDVAALIKLETGVEVITLDLGGWDLHANMGPLNGRMAELLDILTRSLKAFYLDMLGHLDDYVLVVLSEFGRHASENASAGIDHGHGNAMFVMGDVSGGRVVANWPGLHPSALVQGDLAITTDYRDVLGEILVERLGVTDLTPIFPGHTYTHQGVL